MSTRNWDLKLSVNEGIIVFTKLNHFKYCTAALSVFSVGKFDARKSVGAVGGVEMVGSHVSANLLRGKLY